MRFRFRFASPYDLDECQRRIWLLNGITVAIRDRGAMTCIARAHADEAGFAVWTINLIYAGRVTESALAARGRWWTDGAVLRYTVLGALGLFGFALVLRPNASPNSQTELVFLVNGGWVLGIAIKTVA